MQIAVFLTVEAPGRQVSGADLETAAAAIGALPGLRGALLYHPVEDAPDHPFAADGSGPAFAAELRFDERPAAEAALSPERLGRLAWPSLGACTPRLGLFAARDFATPDPMPRTPEPCTFLVRYEGVAADRQAWLDHYDAHHPPIMMRFPGVRAVATYRPLAATVPPGWEPDGALQRNKVVFDDPAALAVALASPVMGEMRADRDAFPPFTGGATHHPMRTRRVR